MPEPPGSVPLKVKLAELLLLGSGGVGGSIVVSGGVASTRAVIGKGALGSANTPFEAVPGNVYAPAVVGVPDRTPAALKDSPGGSAAGSAEKAPSGVPAVDVKEWLYGAFTHEVDGGAGAGGAGETPRWPSALLPQHATTPPVLIPHVW